MASERVELLQGTLDLIVLRALSTMGPQHAYGLAARCLSQRKACGWVTDAAADVAEVRRLARRAVETGPDDAVALTRCPRGRLSQ